MHDAKISNFLIEQWRQEYNHIRPHSSLGYRPPAPEVKMPEKSHSNWYKKGGISNDWGFDLKATVLKVKSRDQEVED